MLYTRLNHVKYCYLSFFRYYDGMKRSVNAMGNPHRNFIYVIETKMRGKWKPNWDFEAHLTYNITEQIMQDFEKYNKHPDNFRIVRYISEKPHDE